MEEIAQDHRASLSGRVMKEPSSSDLKYGTVSTFISQENARFYSDTYLQTGIQKPKNMRTAEKNFYKVQKLSFIIS